MAGAGLDSLSTSLMKDEYDMDDNGGGDEDAICLG
jgi:hypothetical protein